LVQIRRFDKLKFANRYSRAIVSSSEPDNFKCETKADTRTKRGEFLQFFNKKTNFFAYFGQNRYFKAIAHQLKAPKISLNVLNRMKYKFCRIRINVTKMTSHLPQREGFIPPPHPRGKATRLNNLNVENTFTPKYFRVFIIYFNLYFRKESSA